MHNEDKDDLVMIKGFGRRRCSSYRWLHGDLEE